jgi:hypothetical protein
MKKQTAVEWLIEQMPLGIRMNLAENGIDLNQAKAMEREQHFESFRLGNSFIENDRLDFEGYFEEYYKETFRSE